jgi:hypothetical protein
MSIENNKKQHVLITVAYDGMIPFLNRKGPVLNPPTLVYREVADALINLGYDVRIIEKPLTASSTPQAEPLTQDTDETDPEAGNSAEAETGTEPAVETAPAAEPTVETASEPVAEIATPETPVAEEATAPAAVEETPAAPEAEQAAPEAEQAAPEIVEEAAPEVTEEAAEEAPAAEEEADVADNPVDEDEAQDYLWDEESLANHSKKDLFGILAFRGVTVDAKLNRDALVKAVVDSNPKAE